MKRNIVLGLIVLLILAILLSFEIFSGDYDKTLSEYFPAKAPAQKSK